MYRYIHTHTYTQTRQYISGLGPPSFGLAGLQGLALLGPLGVVGLLSERGASVKVIGSETNKYMDQYRYAYICMHIHVIVHVYAYM